MPRNITVTFDDGTQHVYQGAPDDIQPDAVAQRAQQQFGKAVKAMDGGRGAAPAQVSAQPASTPEPQQERFANVPGLIGTALRSGQKINRAFGDLSSGSVVNDARSALGAVMDETGLLGVARGAKDVVDTGAEALAGLYDRVAGRGVTSLVTGSAADRVRAANEAGRAEYDTAIQNPLRNMLGRVAGQAVVTAPVGGVLAAPVRAAAPYVGSAAPVVNRLAEALATSGFRTGAVPTTLGSRIADLGIRAAGGAATGGASGALVDPGSAGASAALGGALPIGVRAAGAAGAGVARLLEGGDKTAARAIANALEVPPNRLQALVQQLRGAETFVPGSRPTVSQVTMEPGAAALEDIVSEASLNNALLAVRRQQSAARDAALEGVAPVQVGGPAQARQDLGEAIGRYAIPEESRISGQINAMYDSPDLAGAQIVIPSQAMADAAGRFVGVGSFGQSANVAQALRTAMGMNRQAPMAAEALTDENILRAITSGTPLNQIGRAERGLAVPGAPAAEVAERGLVPARGGGPLGKLRPAGAADDVIDVGGAQIDRGTPPTSRYVGQDRPMQDVAAPWEAVQRYRSSLNAAIDGLERGPERAALVAMKKTLDDRISSASRGDLLPSEVFSPEAMAAFQGANAAHGNKAQRFLTGPQADIFRRAGNGEPMVQGGEIAAKFWGNRPGAADDVKAFRRLVDDNPALLGQFRSMIATEGAAAAGKSGDLGQKYVNWVRQSLPALREAMEPKNLAVLQNIAKDIARAEKAAASGAPRGSKTFRSANNALRLGLIDNPVVTWAANKVPLGGAVQAAIQRPFRESRANALAELLADPTRAANALESITGSGGFSLGPLTDQLPYRVAPLLTSEK